jgi:hypothetical protein
MILYTKSLHKRVIMIKNNSKSIVSVIHPVNVSTSGYQYMYGYYLMTGKDSYMCISTLCGWRSEF